MIQIQIISVNIRCLLVENKSSQGVKDASTASKYASVCLCNKYFRLIGDIVSPLRAISPSATFGKHRNCWQTLHQIQRTHLCMAHTFYTSNLGVFNWYMLVFFMATFIDP